jgi:hypothetical protein
MTYVDLTLAVARKVAAINCTTLEYINMNGGSLYLSSGAKLVVGITHGKNFKCHIISYAYDQSDLKDIKHLININGRKPANAIA